MNCLTRSLRFYGYFSQGFLISELIGSILNCLNIYHNVVREKGGWGVASYVFQRMNIKVAPANERSSADGDCEIRKVLQGLKPTFFLGLCGTRPRGFPCHALLQSNGTLAVSRVSRSKLDIHLPEMHGRRMVEKQGLFAFILPPVQLCAKGG